ncbi:MAG: HAMP domain-containing sensor histidine kinase [Halieaceae bacterium]
MNFRNILTSVTFRFMLVYVLVLSAAVFLVMALIYGAFTYTYFQELQESVVDELDTLTLIYEGQGVEGVEQYVSDQRELDGGWRFHYLLTDADFGRIAGSLEEWPDYREVGDGWASFGLDVTDFGRGERELELLARPETLSDGTHMLAALRYSDAVEALQLVFRTLLRTMVATVLLGIIGGFFAAAGTLRRIEGINEGISDIVHGDLSQRIPLGDAVGNVRLLIENFNNMLDQTQSLMQGVRTVSDNIAHDLRTPLTRIRNKLSQLQQDTRPGETEKVEAIIEECDGILATFNALLRIAQLEAGNRISNFSQLDLGALVQDVVELYEPLAQEKQIELHSWSDDSSDYDGDRDLVFQMLANLLDNAVKYTPVGGSINVILAAEGDKGLLLSVADTGPGIPEADRENVFQRFFRLESSRSEHPGNGLGLSLVQAVVALHRGTIKLGDNNPGLRVEVSFPG